VCQKISKKSGIIMTIILTNLVNEMTFQERKEVETFAAFIISRRKHDRDYLITLGHWIQ
jgi:hypothetical protein